VGFALFTMLPTHRSVFLKDLMAVGIGDVLLTVEKVMNPGYWQRSEAFRMAKL
jgi:hypothetical protein